MADIETKTEEPGPNYFREKSIEVMEEAVLTREYCTNDECCDACTSIRKLLKNIREAKDKDGKREKVESYLKKSQVSLSDLICDDDLSKPRLSVFMALLKEPNGHLILKPILNSMVEYQTNEEEIRIHLGSGLLYRPEGNKETQVLDELLRLRVLYNTNGYTGKEAVKGILWHPVIQAFIRQKWNKVRFLFFKHIGFWLVFTLAFSFYLRLEINTQLIRRDFYQQRESPEKIGSDFKYQIFWSDSCIRATNKTNTYVDINEEEKTIVEKLKVLIRQEASLLLEENELKICHPNINNISKDASQVFFLTFSLVLIIGWLVFFFRLCYILFYIKEKAKRDKMAFKKMMTLFQIKIVLVCVAISAWSDNQNLKPNPARPFLDYDDGFRFIEFVIFVLAIYLLLESLDQMITLKLWCSHLVDPCNWFQFVAPISGIVAVFWKVHLTDGGAGPVIGLSAIGITLAWLGIILKIGQYSFTVLGNFATMFHILLKKLRFYLMAVFLLLFGFSFGFWVINQHEMKTDDSSFSDFSNSIMDSFVMFFGEFGNYNNALNYRHEIKEGHLLTFMSFYILFLMMIIMSSLGMLNLLMAAIITDYRKNIEEVHTQNLVFIAQYSIVVDKGLMSWFRRKCTKGTRCATMEMLDKKKSYTYCILELCLKEPSDTEHIHLQEEFSSIIQELLSV